MIFWLFIFLLILAVSAFLAYSSMKNFPQIPGSLEGYGVFLIRSPQSLTNEILEELRKNLKNQTISLERLFKGDKRALVIFGPRNSLNKFPELELLELEDYTNLGSEDVLAFEVGMKGNSAFVAGQLSDNEQIWYQMILGLGKGSNFLVQTRIAIISESSKNRQALGENLFNLNKTFSKLPLPQTSSQILESFKKRILLPLRKQRFHSSAKEILSSLGIFPSSQKLSA